LIKISKKEAEFMRKNGYEEFVKHSFSKHKTYYLVEEQNDVYKYNSSIGKRTLERLSALNMLKKYRRSIGITD
jgi:hypothetical protein